jgi:hypothetical protein
MNHILAFSKPPRSFEVWDMPIELKRLRGLAKEDESDDDAWNISGTPVFGTTLSINKLKSVTCR